MSEMLEASNTGYSQKINSNHPGLIMILLDQSESMSHSDKANLAATAVNQVIYEILLRCRRGAEIRDRCDIDVLSYGSSIELLVEGKISKVANIEGIEVETVETYNETGERVKIELPPWVKPKAENGTPMAEAIYKAITLVERWVKEYPHSFPPIVINVTDGAPNDFNKNSADAPRTREAVTRLVKLGTNDGKTLLFNAHIAGSSSLTNEIQLPNNDVEISDPYAKLLFSLSSALPNRLMEEARRVGLSPQPGARGMIFNAHAETLIKLLIFGSSVVG